MWQTSYIPLRLERCYVSLFHGDQCLCVIGSGWGERKRKRAGHDRNGKERREASTFSLFPSFPVHFLLFDYWDTQQDQASTEERVEICYVLICTMVEVVEICWWILSLLIACQSGEDVFKSVTQVAWKKEFFIIQFMVHSSWLGHCVLSLRIRFLLRKSNVSSL